MAKRPAPPPPAAPTTGRLREVSDPPGWWARANAAMDRFFAPVRSELRNPEPKEPHPCPWGHLRCSMCRGFGFLPRTWNSRWALHGVPCPTCHGAGHVKANVPGEPLPIPEGGVICPPCGGSGRDQRHGPTGIDREGVAHACCTCRGAGWTRPKVRPLPGGGYQPVATGAAMPAGVSGAHGASSAQPPGSPPHRGSAGRRPATTDTLAGSVQLLLRREGVRDVLYVETPEYLTAKQEAQVVARVAAAIGPRDDRTWQPVRTRIGGDES